MLIYKVLRQDEWDELATAGVTTGSPADRADGFVHFSTAAQLEGTLEGHFAGETSLWLLAVDAETVGGNLAWEPSRSGALFPHLYRALEHADLLWARPLVDGPDGPLAPPDLE